MVYDISENESTIMAQSESLFISCKTFNNDLKKEEFRRNIDFAWRRVQEFKEKASGKVNKVKEPQPVMTSDHAPCSCGSTFFQRTGTCHICMTCYESQGCS